MVFLRKYMYLESLRALSPVLLGMSCLIFNGPQNEYLHKYVCICNRGYEATKKWAHTGPHRAGKSYKLSSRKILYGDFSFVRVFATENIKLPRNGPTRGETSKHHTKLFVRGNNIYYPKNTTIRFWCTWPHVGSRGHISW